MGNERLRAQRTLRGWSQEDVVRGLVDVGIEIGERQLGVTRSLVSRWERGVTSPRAPYPKLLCLLFQASAEELGLLSLSPPPSPCVTIEGDSIGDGDVERRELFRLLGGGLGASLLPPGLQRGLGTIPPGSSEDDALPLEEAISITDHYRQVLDFRPAHELMGPVLGHLQFVLQLLDSSRSRVAQVQLATAASEAAGFVSRLAFDLNDYAAGCKHHQNAMAYAGRAGNGLLQAYHLAGMSLWAGILEDGGVAVQLMQRANSLIPVNPSPTVRAWFAAREASAHSRVGNHSAALNALDRAEALAEQAGADESPWPWTQPFSHGALAGYQGAIAARLKLPEMALPALQEALGALRPVDKYRALILSDLAISHLPGGEVEEASRLAGEAFDVGVQLGSYRVLQRVREVRSHLTPYRDTSAVRDLDERLAGFLG